MQSIKEKYTKEAVPKMMKEFGLKSPMAVPRILKVVVNVGTGKIRDKKDAVETVEKHLALITGQKPSPRPARIAIASFKTREGMIIGYKVTLRGQKMYDFLDRLINFAIPRTRDFRGIPLKSLDHGGNLTIGIKEHIIFPEMIGEDVRNIFGLEVTVVTNSKKRGEAEKLLRLLGFPLQKNG
ncbi:50S ribosomal protein L5 [Candidatus Giovannonibacteria bacterium RIFCSPLOWO2_12_FULL_44_25]|uniref:Large ribosomal subunit protein uL5 n=3 Tax=Parcubacteria group TaxID=1794811 RepID=A0A837IMY9_9BACT|nr:MAG: 50S ribosomal protein L5, large subunit ribosomal protein L5 [Parcubacteria group bacterium GW2011_GWC1_44_10]KKT60170.1 MAG: 50S ribosomal protein L5 [Candidatus Giovannonibacteria bacterium GW2011_GWA1_44_25]KKU12377.1 MAG: 50S ribosomal protein L5 [Candidatus Azambacteria bacterium GW2011_GWC2_45_7b]KKU30017.1 MAG: 50S ribosomal protein L5 [Candidatus Giovannonibacteria bacterium GW2011_GWB1_46_20]OGF49374.1 MAG: 50S ribosomal protein L5 [Candidatus Giovannonibacteria bacterium GWA2_